MKSLLSALPRTTSKPKRRVGRGIGSTKGGHTSGRGQKGQKARSHVGLLFMGTKNKKSLIQRLPALRGKNKFKSLARQKVTLSLTDLNLLEPKSMVTVEALIVAGKVKGPVSPKLRVKVVGTGEITVPLQVAVPVTATAKEKIEAAGGSVVEA